MAWSSHQLLFSSWSDASSSGSGGLPSALILTRPSTGGGLGAGRITPPHFPLLLWEQKARSHHRVWQSWCRMGWGAGDKSLKVLLCVAASAPQVPCSGLSSSWSRQSGTGLGASEMMKGEPRAQGNPGILAHSLALITALVGMREG